MIELYRELREILPGIKCDLVSNRIELKMVRRYAIEKSNDGYNIIYIVVGCISRVKDYSHPEVLNLFQGIHKRFQVAENLRQNLLSSLSDFNVTIEVRDCTPVALVLEFYYKSIHIFRFGDDEIKIILPSGATSNFMSLSQTITKIRAELVRMLSQKYWGAVDHLKNEYIDIKSVKSVKGNQDIEDSNSLLERVCCIVNQQTELSIQHSRRS